MTRFAANMPCPTARPSHVEPPLKKMRLSELRASSQRQWMPRSFTGGGHRAICTEGGLTRLSKDKSIPHQKQEQEQGQEQEQEEEQGQEQEQDEEQKQEREQQQQQQ